MSAACLLSNACCSSPSPFSPRHVLAMLGTVSLPGDGRIGDAEGVHHRQQSLSQGVESNIAP
jgi:hypothetical protein